MEGPADLAGRVGRVLDREVQVSDHMPSMVGTLDRELPEVAVTAQNECRRALRDFLRDLVAGARLEWQVAADIRTRLIGVNVVDVLVGHRAQHEPRRTHWRKELIG
jgi:hypothetical protein